MPERPDEERQEGEEPADRADPDRLAQADQAAEVAAENRPDRDRAPDDEPHRRVHPTLHAGWRDRLPEADLGDVVDHPGQAGDEPGGNEERYGALARRDRDQQLADP